MAHNHSKCKKDQPELETNWLNNVPQQENTIREVYDLLFELSQQKQHFQVKIDNT